MDKVEKVLELYKLVDGDVKTFPIDAEQIIISDFTYSAKRMGGAPTITCSIYHPSPIDGDFDESVYTEFNGEKFYLHRRPSATKGNSDTRYKYDLEFVSERIVLDGVYFIDIVAESTYRGMSNSTKFMFSGDIHEFAKRMNYSLGYSKVGYVVTVDKGVESDTHNMSFDNMVFSQVLQEVYNTYNIPYYFQGKEIHIGEAPDDSKLGVNLEYGADKSLLSITKQSANNKVINRITGMGSSDNIPYYYPNETAHGKVRIEPKPDNPLIESYEIVDNKLLGERVEINNPVKFTLLGGSGLKAPITTVDYEYYDPQGGDYIKSAFAVIGDYSDTHEARLIYPYEKNPKTPFREDHPHDGLCSYRYRVRLTGEIEDNTGGIIRWLWDALPGSDIYKEIEQGGRIDFGFFDNLVVYEGGNDYEKISITPKIIGTYPSIYIDTPFVGREKRDSANILQGRAFDITMEFTFWKHNIYGKTNPNDVCKMNFRSVDFRSDDIQAFVWKGSRYYSKNITDFGVSISQEDLDRIQEMPDRYVGEYFTLLRESYITPSQNLMPPVYRETEGAERFYNATNYPFLYEDGYSLIDGEYLKKENEKGEPTELDYVHNDHYKQDDGKYIKFTNPYIEGHPKEHVESFDSIKPTIVGMRNEVGKDDDGLGQPYNQFLAFAYDDNDNDEIDETTETLLHPYFFAKLPKYNGKGKFNLFDHASEAGPMRISMTSGNCGACTFDIAVDKNSQKNTVQVDSDGNLLRDEQGRVVFGSPQEEQNDTINNSVWIALHKDVSTFPSAMPNEGTRNKPTPDDTFVILNILLPDGYIRDAEERLKDALIAYMHDNNDYKWNFSVNLSRIYLAEHQDDVLPYLNENSSVVLTYQGTEHSLYVSSFTYKMTGKDILPEISIELADTLTINQSPLDAVVSTIKTDVLSTIAGINIARQGTPYFLRKDIDDTASGKITLEQGFNSQGNGDFGGFVNDTKGTGIYQDASGNWHIETDYIKARKKLSAKNVEIEDAHHIGGQQLLTSASAIIDYVLVCDGFYRCYFLKRDTSGRTIVNKWKTNDQAYCRVLNVGDGTTIEDRFYWRKVVATSNEKEDENLTIDTGEGSIITSNYHFIDLSITSCALDSDVPRILDNVAQLGYQGDDAPERQNAIVLAGAGEGSPYICQYTGIDSFVLPEPDTQIKPNDNVFTGKTVFKAGSSGLENIQEWAEKQEQLNKATEASEIAYNIASTVTKDIETINSQLDGVIIHHFWAGQPTIDNYPAENWNTYDLKKQHVGDTYTNTNSYEVDESGGKSWRWVEEDGSFTWKEISDNDAVKALKKAKDAQITADGKTRTFIEQPYPPYDTGDLWSQGANAPLKMCIKSKREGLFDANDWTLADNAQAYTDALRDEIEEQIQNTTNALQGKIDEANSLIGKNGEYAKELDAAIKALEESQASVDEIVEEVLKDGKITNLEQTAMNAATEAANAAMAVYDELVKALADDNYIDDEEAAKIAGAMAIWEKAQKYAEEKAKEAKQEAIDEINNTIENLESTNGNLIRNSGFTGDYITAELQSGSSLKDAFAMFSPSLEHWTATNTIARNSDYSQSGKEAYMSSQGSISQELLHQVKVNEDYIISLYGKGGSLTVYFGGATRVIELGSSYTRHILRITPTTSTNTISFYGTYGTTLCDLMLEKGNVPSDWVPSVLDNHSELAKYETLTYLKNLLQVETSVDGSSVSTGIVNTGLINMGHYDTNGKRVRVTAGLSGTFNNDNSVAFFGGGSLEQALQAVYMFDGNPSYQPTEAELANIAKVVITHGGRAILQDIILRGYIYAKGGVFNGTVYAKDGEFKGKVTATEGEFNGVVKTSLSYSKTGIIATDTYTINPQQEPISWFKVEPIGLQDDPRQIYLPSAALYDGLEITFFLAPSTRAAVHNHVVTALTEEKIVFPMNLVQVAIYSSTPTTEIIPTTVKTENATMLERQSVTMVCFGEVRFKAIASEKKWYAVSGSFTGE